MGKMTEWFRRAMATERDTWAAGGPPKVAEVRQVTAFAPRAKGTETMAWVKELRAGRLFAGVYLDAAAGELVRAAANPRREEPERAPLAGATARVEAAGAKRTRGMGGVMVGGIGIGVAPSKDERELYLIIDHQAGQWAVPCPPAEGAAARQFAANVTTAGMAAG